MKKIKTALKRKGRPIEINPTDVAEEHLAAVGTSVRTLEKDILSGEMPLDKRQLLN